MASNGVAVKVRPEKVQRSMPIRHPCPKSVHPCSLSDGFFRLPGLDSSGFPRTSKRFLFGFPSSWEETMAPSTERTLCLHPTGLPHRTGSRRVTAQNSRAETVVRYYSSCPQTLVWITYEHISLGQRLGILAVAQCSLYKAACCRTEWEPTHSQDEALLCE